MSTPTLIGRMARALGDTAIVSVHCHDDLGLAVANSLAAVQAGARQVECTINGIGERAGNCALEELVMAIRVRQDRLPFEVGIVTEHLFPASQLLTELISFGPQPNKAIVGRNAFAHEAGIHQDGFLKERTTYEIMDPRIGGRAREPPGAGQAQRAPRPPGPLRASRLSSCPGTSWTRSTSASSPWRIARRAYSTRRSWRSSARLWTTAPRPFASRLRRLPRSRYNQAFPC